MKYIPLSQGKFALIDDEDFESVRRFKWRVHRGKHEHSMEYAVTTIRYKSKYCSKLLLHRLLMGDPQGLQVDHANHNGLDCRRFNLRVCTHQQNCFNRRPEVVSSSKYKGVSWKKSRNVWIAKIHIDGVGVHLGVFSNERKAAQVYDAKATELFGEFACLNSRFF